MKAMRVLLAEDHPLAIEGVRRILAPEFEVVEAVGDGRALVTACERLNPDVVILDIALPLLSGIEAVRRIRKTNQRAIIVFLTMHSGPADVKAALEAGALAYVHKTSAGAELLKAVQEARRGRVFVSDSAARQQTDVPPKKSSGSARGDYSLTARQREVLRLVAEGRTTKECAQLLRLSPRTVEFHKHRLMEQLALHTVAELTRFAIQQGLL